MWPDKARLNIYFSPFEIPTLTRDVATRISGRKWVQRTELDMVNGSFCNLCALAVWLALHIFATQCWRVPKRTKQLSTVAILLYRFFTVMLVSRNVFHVVSALQSIVVIHIFSADQVSCRSYVGRVYRMQSIAVCYSFVKLSTRYGRVILVGGYLGLTVVNWS